MSRPIAALVIVLSLLLALELVDWHLRVFTLLHWPAETVHPDGVCVYHARKVMEGRPLYADWREPPYVVAPYGPLFYGVAGSIGRALQVDTFGLFIIGRWMSLLSTWGTAWLILVVLWRWHRAGFLVGATAGGMFLLTTVNYPMAVAFRPDAPAVLFSVLGLVIAERWGARGLGLLSLVPFVLALLFKQSFIGGPAAVVLFCLVRRRFRDGLLYALAVVLAFGGTVAVAQALSGGGYWLNCVEGLRAPRNWENTVSVVLPVLVRNLPLLLVAGVVLVSEVIQRRPSLYAVMFGTSFALAELATVRVGAAANYFMECCAVACLLIGAKAPRLYSTAAAARRDAAAPGPVENARGEPVQVRPGSGRRWVLCGLLGVFAVHHGLRTSQIVGVLPATATEFARRHVAADEARREILETVRWIDQLSQGRPVICLDSSLAIHLATDPVVMDPFLISGLCELGRFRDEQRVADNIRGGFYGAIVLDYQHAQEQSGAYYQGAAVFPREWMAALRDTRPPPYRLAGSPHGLTELGRSGPTEEPPRYRHFGSPKPFIDVYVPAEQPAQTR